MASEILALKIIIFIFSIVIHEVMHGVIALRYGDRTALNAGRLTLNPLPHIDPIGTVLMPLILALAGGPILGAAKPVPVNPLNFNNIRQGELAVSAAGILANFGLVIIGALLYNLLPQTTSFIAVAQLLSFLVSINLALGIFNLIPIPPLDGSKIVMALLPYEAAREYAKLEQYGIFIILGLMYFRILSLITQPLLLIASALLNVPLSFF